MRIFKDKTKYQDYAFDFKYDDKIIDFCNVLKKEYGWKQINFDSDSKLWRFSKKEILEKIVKQYGDKINVDDQVKKEWRRWKERNADKEERRGEAQKIKNQDTADIDIDLNGELYDFQKVGVKFLENAKGRGMIFDEMGTGKTIQSIAFAESGNRHPALIICPASVKYSWKSEIEDWTNKKAMVINSQDYEEPSELRFPLDCDYFIINYHILKKFYDQLENKEFELLVADESHMVKNKDAQRTKYTKKLAMQTDNVVLLSGTPMLNRPEELYTALNMVDPDTWDSWWDYTGRYCDRTKTHFGLDVSGASNIDELSNRIDHFYIRRTKDEVLGELPDKVFNEIPVHFTDTMREKYELAENDYPQYLREFTDKSESEIEKSLQAEQLSQLNELRQLTTQAKQTNAVNFVESFVEQRKKLLVFSCYTDPLKMLNNTVEENSVIITGESDSKEREEAVDQFQTNEDKLIFLGGMQSANTGITLTAASNVLFIDFDFTPANMLQAIDRCHRPGTDADVVNVNQMVVPHTIDSYMQEILGNKQELFDNIIEGEGLSNEEVKEQLFNKITS